MSPPMTVGEFALATGLSAKAHAAELRRRRDLEDRALALAVAGVYAAPDPDDDGAPASGGAVPLRPPGFYPGTCRGLTEAERAERRRVRPAALRIDAAKVAGLPAGEIPRATAVDVLHGEVTGLVDDLVLRRNDGAYAYNLAVVVDDLAQGVDQVVRGDDLLDSAPRQRWLAEVLCAARGEPTPAVEYLHVPLVLNTEGRRLAKRDGAVTLEDLCGKAETLGIKAPQGDLDFTI